MPRIVESPDILKLDRWAERLARLTRTAWLGPDGKCYFPYAPLTEPEFWADSVAADWRAGRIRSWVMIEGAEIVAHVALVQKGEGWELGRWVALPNAPRGAVTALSRRAMACARRHGLRVRVECTQAHTSSQHICRQLGLRWAGIGILDEIDGVVWDIIYFDNQPGPSFRPRPGVLGDPLGQPVVCRPEHRRRLAEIASLITTDRGEPLPPQQFHLLAELVEPVQEIIKLNR